MRMLHAWLLTAVLTGLGGCASVSPAPPQPPPLAGLFEDGAFGAPREQPDAAAIFALSPAMRDYLDHDLAPMIRRQGAQQALVNALGTEAQLRLEYETDRTRNAAETFGARAGNCLSLVVMTAAMARHLELPYTFQALLGYENWSRSAGLSLVNGHVNITVAKRLVDRVAAYDSSGQLRIDFGSVGVGRAQALRVITEQTIKAMFMNNRAAEHLVGGALDDAYAYAREAVKQDAAYASAYNTLGVIYERRGMRAAAERAFRQTLAVDADHRAALRNLAQLLERQERRAEAAVFTDRLDRLEVEAPFAHFDLGVAAVRDGRYDEGKAHLLREMRRDPDYHEFHFWLALAFYGLGQTQQARDHLSAAMKNSVTVREQALYAAKLRGLQATAPGGNVNR